MSDCITITRDSISAITQYINLLPMFWLLPTHSQDFCHLIAIFKQKSEWSVVDFYLRQRSCGKVIFSVVSVCQSFSPQGWSHVTVTHDALHCTGSSVQGPCPCPLLLVTSRGKDFIPVQTCSLEDLTVQTPPHQGWHLVAGYVRRAGRQYIS